MFIVHSRVVLCPIYIHSYVIQVKGCQNDSCSLLYLSIYIFVHHCDNVVKGLLFEIGLIMYLSVYCFRIQKIHFKVVNLQ